LIRGSSVKASYALRCAVGKTVEAEVDTKGLYIVAHIVDDAAWGKVTSGVYKGFSIGGKTLARDPKDKKVVTKVRLDEISLVDRPSNPEVRFDVWKSAGPPTLDEVFESMLGEDRALALIKATHRLARTRAVRPPRRLVFHSL
jgi:hypothetical protein